VPLPLLPVLAEEADDSVEGLLVALAVVLALLDVAAAEVVELDEFRAVEDEDLPAYDAAAT